VTDAPAVTDLAVRVTWLGDGFYEELTGPSRQTHTGAAILLSFPSARRLQGSRLLETAIGFSGQFPKLSFQSAR